MRIITCILLGTCFLLSNCKSSLTVEESQEILSDATLFHDALDQLTDVIVHDIFSPPVASRVYVYPCIAAYQVLSSKDDRLTDLSKVVNELQPLPAIKKDDISFELAALEAFLIVGKKLVFSEDKMDAYSAGLYGRLDSLGVSKKLVQSSREYGSQVAKHIIQWSDTDNYKESRSFSKFSVTDDPREWKPTPPAYMEGIEPHWREIRTMVIDSAQQFVPNAPPEFDTEKDSEFYRLMLEVYDTVNGLDEEKKEIASFWDCNPFVMNQTGHIMYATKKITPGGHWMGISNIASKVAGHDITESIKVSTYVAIALYDGFISCWDEKYRSNLVRPETVINEYIDEDWIPLLQTPPFPEHTSGHSVISTAAAEMLTYLMGNGFEYKDDVEVKYGLPERSYQSFKEASAEAAISRLYGGIHYMPAITDGVKQGREVGLYIIDKFQNAE